MATLWSPQAVGEPPRWLSALAVPAAAASDEPPHEHQREQETMRGDDQPEDKPHQEPVRADEPAAWMALVFLRAGPGARLASRPLPRAHQHMNSR